MSLALSRRQAFKVMLGLGGTAATSLLPEPANASRGPAGRNRHAL
jgi:hypothetical protein